MHSRRNQCNAADYIAQQDRHEKLDHAPEERAAPGISVAPKSGCHPNNVHLFDRGRPVRDNLSSFVFMGSSSCGMRRALHPADSDIATRFAQVCDNGHGSR